MPTHPGTGIPYWVLNIGMIWTVPGWLEFQSHKGMSELIPIIDERYVEIKWKRNVSNPDPEPLGM